ncbi:DNA repair protein RadC [Clostridium sp.]|uniref:RadC family protein n=1 Tax=Clostridium sp. TaxID=1506 RepID=UPI0028401D1B|nr:DNA repair protein RadC [Clostridium sp.]MDR3597694.1 DNA repair protein RadC [Clostridium sp.]
MSYLNNLSDTELLGLIIKEKSNEMISDNLVNKFSSLDNLLINTSEEELKSIKGLSNKRIEQIKAIAEISRRLYSKSNIKNYKINTPSDIANYIMNDLRFLNQEHFIVISLNTKNMILNSKTIFIGTLNSSLVHPREIFLQAIKSSANSIIVCHNHPSGDVNPSQEDINITLRLKECGKILGINLIDHIIIGDTNHKSLKEDGVI